MSRGDCGNDPSSETTFVSTPDTADTGTARYKRISPPALSNMKPPSLHNRDAYSDATANEEEDPEVQYARRRARILAPPEDVITPIEVDTPLTAPPLGAVVRDERDIPPAPRSQPDPPQFVKAPPRPSDTPSLPSTASTSVSTSPQSPKLVVALPGTMSSRRERSKNGVHASPNKRIVQKRRPLVSRWKSKFREVFSYSPPDESQLERINDRHWADEDP